MMVRVFELNWDQTLSNTSEHLPSELIVDVRFERDPQRLQLAIMDHLDAEYQAVVENFKWEEI
jgi:hypothetical protein